MSNIQYRNVEVGCVSTRLPAYPPTRLFLVGPLGRIVRHQPQLADPFALHLRDLQRAAFDAYPVPVLREPAELPEHVAAEGLVVLIGDTEAVFLVGVGQAE